MDFVFQILFLFGLYVVFQKWQSGELEGYLDPYLASKALGAKYDRGFEGSLYPHNPYIKSRSCLPEGEQR